MSVFLIAHIVEGSTTRPLSSGSWSFNWSTTLSWFEVGTPDRTSVREDQAQPEVINSNSFELGTERPIPAVRLLPGAITWSVMYLPCMCGVSGRVRALSYPLHISNVWFRRRLDWLPEVRKQMEICAHTTIKVPDGADGGGPEVESETTEDQRD